MNSAWYIAIICVLILGLGAVMAGDGVGWPPEKLRIILTGGGTGGHVNPALAIAEGIKKREPAVRFLYIGVRGKAESVIVKRAGYPSPVCLLGGIPRIKALLSAGAFSLQTDLGTSCSAAIILLGLLPAG